MFIRQMIYYDKKYHTKKHLSVKELKNIIIFNREKFYAHITDLEQGHNNHTPLTLYRFAWLDTNEAGRRVSFQCRYNKIGNSLRVFIFFKSI